MDKFVNNCSIKMMSKITKRRQSPIETNDYSNIENTISPSLNKKSGFSFSKSKKINDVKKVNDPKLYVKYTAVDPNLKSPIIKENIIKSKSNTSNIVL